MRFGLLLLLLAAAAGLLYLAAGAWLESAGGQRALERELTERAGLPVQMLGAFDIMLYPAVGVAGTELVIGGPGVEEAFLHSREYSVALALRPLIQGVLQVDSLRLAHGVLRLDRWPPSEPRVPGRSGAALKLPAIGGFTVSDFTLVFPGEPGYRLGISELAIDGFEELRDSPYRIESPGLGRIAGLFLWDPLAPELGIRGNWSGLTAEDFEFNGEVNIATVSGRAAVRWPARTADGQETLALSARFELLEEDLRLEGIALAAGAQEVRGDGCLLLAGTPSLRLDLAADTLDLDRLPDFPSFATAPGNGSAPAGGLEFAVRLRAGELRRAGVLARNAVVSLGEDPDCGALD